MIRVVIVDDHPIVRAGIKAVLSEAADIRVAAEGGTGADALRWVDHEQPDVLILDINLPDISGLEVIRRLKQKKTQVAVIILTVRTDSSMILDLLECGALGYILKDEALETLVNAVRTVARGEHWLSPAVASIVVQRAINQKEPLKNGIPVPETMTGLTSREFEVLGLMATGLSNVAIAERLVLTTRTVQNHVSTIYGKLGVASRAEAILYAIRKHLVQVSAEEQHIDDL